MSYIVFYNVYSLGIDDQSPLVLGGDNIFGGDNILAFCQYCKTISMYFFQTANLKKIHAAPEGWKCKVLLDLFCQVETHKNPNLKFVE